MEWHSANNPEILSKKFSGNSEMDSVPLSDLFDDLITISQTFL